MKMFDNTMGVVPIWCKKENQTREDIEEKLIKMLCDK